MKKLIVVLTVCVFAITGETSAQGAGKVSLQDLHITTKLKEGPNTVIINKLKGTLKFVKQGNSFSNVVFLDSLGVRTLLNPTSGGANGAPKPECKTKLPDVCFSSPNKNIGLCICKPGDLSNGGEGTYLIGMLLPAVQKVREAANRQ